MKKILMVIVAAGLSGCLASSPTTTPNVHAAAQVDCSNPRPMVCTMEYRPVCASLLAGGERRMPRGVTRVLILLSQAICPKRVKISNNTTIIMLLVQSRREMPCP